MEKVDKAFNLLSELDINQFKTECATSLLYMIHTAMESGPDAIDEIHIDALYGAYDYLDKLNKERDKTFKDLYAEYFKRNKEIA